jgi:membrane protein DedA with SNARE-associated domain
MRLARVTLAAAVVAVTWAADLAYACPSCASPLEENRQAFVDTTVFLTIVPLVMIGGFIWWLRRKIREMDGAPEIHP